MSFTVQCQCNSSGVPNLGDASLWGEAIGIEVMITWVQLYRCRDSIYVKGKVEAR
jgi:hypothetical protein